jgi:hypothetical protein
MKLFGSFDWQMISFVAMTLVNEYIVNVHFPKAYYWNGRREYEAKANRKKTIKDDDKKIT